MAIEIKQLIIKSNVLQQHEEQAARLPAEDLRVLKQEVLNECRRLITELLRRRGER